MYEPERLRAARVTHVEVRKAEKRLAPYLAGFPSPMIDTRRLRIANGRASKQDEREIRAEDYVIRRLRERGDLPKENP